MPLLHISSAETFGDKGVIKVTGYQVEGGENFSASTFEKRFLECVDKEVTAYLVQNGKYLNITFKEPENQQPQPPSPQPPVTTPAPQPQQQITTPSPVSKLEKILTNSQSKMLAIGADKETVLKELGFARMLMEANPVLLNCAESHIVNAVVNVVRIGTTLNPALGLAHLVPYKGVTKLHIDYKGLLAILKNYGAIKFGKAVIVYEDEIFEPSDLPTEKHLHQIKYAKSEEEQKKRKIAGVYGVYTLNERDNTTIWTEFTPMWEINKIRNASPAAGKDSSPWNTWFEEMVKKSKIRRDFKTLIEGKPDERLSAAIEVDNEEFVGGKTQDIDKMNEVISQMKAAAESGDEKTLMKLFQSHSQFHADMDFINENAACWDLIDARKNG